MCYKRIPPNSYSHGGLHRHKESGDHTCNTKCPFCGYYVSIFNVPFTTTLVSSLCCLVSFSIRCLQCTLKYGHIEREHSTQHGNMNLTRFIAEDDEFEYRGIRFSIS